MLTTSVNTIPHTTDVNKPKVIPGWSDVEPHRESAIFWHGMWKDNGSPRQGILADIRRSTRARYHYAIRYVKRNMVHVSSERMANALANNDGRDFWQEVKKIKGRNSTVSSIVDNCCDPKSIAETFGLKYSELYNSVPSCNNELQTIMEKVSRKCDESCTNIDGNEKPKHFHSISASDVIQAIEHLKSDKSDGNDGLYSNHFIMGTQKLKIHLAFILNAMLIHGYNPGSLLLSTMIPIPKDSRKSLANSNNYRAIALSAILGKIMDWICLSRQPNIFASHHLQFGYKAGHSTTMCTGIVQETIQYYLSGNSEVYVVLLDASKAFDRLNHAKLFEKLFNKGMCPLALRFIINQYNNQVMQVKWDSSISDKFNVCNGIKQGGVLSPLLFSVYMDDLLKKLEANKLGCHIGHRCSGAFAYADDITLLAPTRQGMENMLKVCDKYAEDFDIQFNPTKSKLIHFGNNESSCPLDLKVAGAVISVVDCDLHLGSYLCKDFQARNIADKSRDFIWRTNSIIADFRGVSSHVKATLHNKYCLSVNGSQLWDYSSNHVEKFYVAWRKAVRWIWNLSNITHCNLLSSLHGSLPIDVLLEKRAVKMVKSMCQSEFMDYVVRNSVFHVRSTLGENIKYFMYKYKIPYTYWHLHSDQGIVKGNVIQDYLTTQPTDGNNQGSLLQELCLTRDGVLNLDILSTQEVQLLIDNISTA